MNSQIKQISIKCLIKNNILRSAVIVKFITENDHFIDVLVTCTHCGVVRKVIVMIALSCFANVLLNNFYEDFITSKGSRKLITELHGLL